MNKRNQTFNYLQAMLILMVIDDHVATQIGFLSSLFPYDSFFMPLFVIISGYFYKPRSVKDNFIHKFKRIYIPYTVWSVVGNFAAWVLGRVSIVEWYTPLTVRNIAKQLFGGSLSSITGAGWFAVMLFAVSVLYNLLCNLIGFAQNGLHRNPDAEKQPSIECYSRTVNYVMMAFMIVIGMVSVWCCMKEFTQSEAVIVVFRTLFYLQFFHIGRMFRLYWEKSVQHWNKGTVCIICILANVLLLSLWGDRIRFIATARMGNFNSWYLPLITTATGGLFWYEIARALSEKLGELKWINFLAGNTFTIMMTHLAFANIPNFVAAATAATGFDYQRFQESAWYAFNGTTKLIGFFCGLAGSLLCAAIVSKIKSTTAMILKRS